ncbi:NAD-dependent epimerase/dehydratase [Penicillium vulpinum]|uniref:NAD-dependent epimerase/dehydratase n=1 Tax=Penicillium vulpinum TaxID=29845 RepID=UPI0025465A76|nr:NAD-dependent epimerase/dehydratase [Penicillium vulpinum]KAJ5959220.1 NAD-dependent epimerase/dehydratase [Penicillium vulpinum]
MTKEKLPPKPLATPTESNTASTFASRGSHMDASDDHVVSSFIASALAGKDLKIAGNDVASLSFQYVTDCTQALPDITLAREVLEWVPVIRLENELWRIIEWNMKEGHSN